MEKRNKLFIFGSIAFVVLLLCGATVVVTILKMNSNANYYDTVSGTQSTYNTKTVSESMTLAPSVSPQAGSMGDSYSGIDRNSSASPDQKIIKNASISMIVSDLDKSSADITKLAKDFNGNVMNLNDSGKDNSRVVSITMRVPSEKFDEAIAQVKAAGDEVMNVQVNADDITQVYTDLQSRLKNLKASETQYLEIMQRAGEIKDVLAVQVELTNVRSQIEVLEGQIKYYDAYTEYSTISLSMSVNPENIVIEEEVWRPAAIVKEAFSAFVEVLKGLVSVIIWILVFSPIVLVPALIIWIAVKIIKKKDSQSTDIKK